MGNFIVLKVHYNYEITKEQMLTLVNYSYEEDIQEYLTEKYSSSITFNLHPMYSPYGVDVTICESVNTIALRERISIDIQKFIKKAEKHNQRDKKCKKK